MTIASVGLLMRGVLLTMMKRGSLPSDNPALAEEVRAFVIAHDGVAKAQAVLDYYIEKAIKTLQPLPTSAEKSYLAKLSLFVGARDV